MTAILAFFFFIIPFQFALSPAQGIDLAIIRLAAIGVFFFWLLYGGVRRKLWLPTDISAFLFLSFIALAAVSFLWAEQSEFALRKILFLLSFAPLFIVLVSVFREAPGARLRVLRAYVFGAGAAAVVGILIFFSQFLFGVERVFAVLSQSVLPFFLGQSFGQAVASYPSLLVNISGATVLRASAFFPDPHMFSFYVGMAAPAALMLYLASPARPKLWLALFVALLSADLLSFSRGGYAGLLLSGVMFLFISGVLRSWSMRKTLVTFGLIALLSIGIGVTPFGERLVSSFSGEDGSNRERLRLWQEAAGHIGERPLFGTGLGNYPLLVKPSASYREPIYAHNLYLDIALELGLVGLGLFLALVGLVLKRAWRAWKRADVLGIIVILSLTVFLGHALFETPLFSVHILPVLLLFLSLGVSCQHDEQNHS